MTPIETTHRKEHHMTATPAPTLATSPAPAPIPTTFDEAIAEFRARMRGSVLTLADDGYDDARAAWNVAVDQRPALIAVAASTDDVVAAVRFARTNNLRVAIQATGHGVARPANGALLIVTSELCDVSVDPVARTARIAAGSKWGPVLAASQQHGLAPLLGSSSQVGAIGYMLGGGIGWLARRYGLGSDSVVGIDLVTPDGILTHASATEQPELFWALKGGGAGTLGVVTSMEIELYPVSTVYAGNLLYPAEAAAEVVARWRDWVATAGAELTSSVVMMNFPPIPDVPEPLRGRSFTIVRGCWSGELEAGQQLVDHWRTWRAPEFDMFGPMPFSDVDTISNDPVDPVPVMLTTEWADQVSDEMVDVLLERTFPAPGRPPVLMFAEIRHAGGAVRELAAGSVAAAGRSGEFLVEMVGAIMEPNAAPMLEAWLRQARQRLAAHVTGATYLNFTEGCERQERTASSFTPEHHARLRAVKAALDPADRFCHGLGVHPA